MAACQQAISSSDENSSSADSDDDESSSDGLDSSISSWTYICKSFSEILSSGERINIDYAFKAAEQAVLNEEPINSLQLYAMGLKQMCNEMYQSDKDNENRCRHLGEKTHVIHLLDIICLAINQCAILISIENGDTSFNPFKITVRQSLDVIMECCELLSSVDIKLLCSAASLYFSLKDHMNGFQLATRAVQMEPLSTLAQETYENMCCHLVERWHFAMLNDLSRNQAYQKALCGTMKNVSFTPLIYDIGSGTGLLSLIASDQNNSSQVFAIEKSSIMCMVAKDILKANLSPEQAQRVTIINKMSTTMSVPKDMNQRADILVTEIFDAGLFGEGILPTLCHAWSNLLKNSDILKGIVIPSKAELYIQVVECDYISAENRFCGKYGDLNFEDIFVCSTIGMCAPDPYTTQDLKNLPGGYKVLSEPLRFMEVDFNNPEELIKLNKGMTQQFSITVTQNGRLDALAMWFTLHLDSSIQINTHTSSNSCWEQAIFPVHSIKLHLPSNSKAQTNALNVVTDDIVNISQCVKGGKLCMDVTSVTKSKSAEVTCCPEVAQAVTKFLCTVSEWYKHHVFCLNTSDIASLNNTELHSTIIHHIQEVRQSVQADHLTFVHLNHGFSPLCLKALQAGFEKSTAIVHNPCHHFLLRSLSSTNNIDLKKLLLVDDIDGFVDLMDSKGPREGSEQQKVVVMCDVVDNQGRIVENLSDQLNVLKFCLSDFCVEQVIPRQVDVYGVLIESKDLVHLSRILSDENTLGYNIGAFFNKFSTKNYQGIMLSTLEHKKLTEPFKIFSIDLNKIFSVHNKLSNQASSSSFSKDQSPDIVSSNDGTCVESGNKKNNNVTYEGSICDHNHIPNLHVHQGLTFHNNDTVPVEDVSCHATCSFSQAELNNISGNQKTITCQSSLTNKPTTPTQMSPIAQKVPGKTTLTCVANENKVQTIKDLNYYTEPVCKETLQQCKDLNDCSYEQISGNKLHSFCSTSNVRNISENLSDENKDNLNKTKQPNSEMDQTQHLEISVAQSGNIDALVYWYNLHLSPAITVNTLNFPYHYQQAAVMSPQSPAVTQGDILNLQVKLGNSALSFNFDNKHHINRP